MRKQFFAIRTFILLACVPCFTQSSIYDEEVIANNLVIFKTELHALLFARELPPDTRVIVSDMFDSRTKADKWTVNKENELVHPSTSFAWVDEESFSVWRSDEKVYLFPVDIRYQFLPDTNFIDFKGKSVSAKHSKKGNQYIYIKTVYDKNKLTDSTYYHQFADSVFRYVCYFSFDDSMELYVNQYNHLPSLSYLKSIHTFTDTSFEGYRNDLERIVHTLKKDKEGKISEVRVTIYSEETNEIISQHKMNIIYPASPK
jgi:hypothetical protein